MPLPKDQAWFPTKRFGYGWGLPIRWQGWVVMIAYGAALVAGPRIMRAGVPYFVAYVFGLSTVLCLICWWKGEPARWRWGDDK